MELTIDQALKKAVEAHKAGQIQDADRLYTAILKAEPDHPDANHNLGVLAVGIGNVEEALPLLKTALEANPSIAQFWVSYIDALIKLDKLADAKAVLDQAKSKGAEGDGFDQLKERLAKASVVPGPTQDKVQGLINLYNQGQLQQAVDEANTLIKQFPNSATLFNIQGAVLKALGQLDLSVYAFNKALTIKPDYVQAYNNMGVTLQDQGKVEEAIEAYNKALVIKPDHAETYYNMGTVLQKQGKLEEAIAAYKAALSIDPNNAEAYNNMGVTLQDQGKVEEAIEAYNKALVIKPDYAEVYNNMGVTLQDQGKVEEAIEAYKKALVIKPDHAEAYNNMGDALRADGKIKEALAYFQAAGQHGYKRKNKTWRDIIDCQDETLRKIVRDHFKVENEKLLRSTEWFIQKEKQYGGRVNGVRRTMRSPYENSDSVQLLNGHIGGDRMDFAIGCHWYAPIYSLAINSYLMENSIDPMHTNLLVSEIGILNGSGLAIWSDAFPASRITGFDLDLQIYEKNKTFLLRQGAFQNGMPETFQIDQYEVSELEVKQKVNGQKINICIDDGAHTDESIINTFSAFKKNLCDEFLYFVEDNLNTKSFLSPLHSDIEIKQFGEMAVIFPSSSNILNKVDTIDDILKSIGISPDEIWGSI